MKISRFILIAISIIFPQCKKYPGDRNFIQPDIRIQKEFGKSIVEQIQFRNNNNSTLSIKERFKDWYHTNFFGIASFAAKKDYICKLFVQKLTKKNYNYKKKQFALRAINLSRLTEFKALKPYFFDKDDRCIINLKENYDDYIKNVKHLLDSNAMPLDLLYTVLITWKTLKLKRFPFKSLKYYIQNKDSCIFNSAENKFNYLLYLYYKNKIIGLFLTLKFGIDENELIEKELIEKELIENGNYEKVEFIYETRDEKKEITSRTKTFYSVKNFKNKKKNALYIIPKYCHNGAFYTVKRNKFLHFQLQSKYNLKIIQISSIEDLKNQINGIDGIIKFSLIIFGGHGWDGGLTLSRKKSLTTRNIAKIKGIFDKNILDTTHWILQSCSVGLSTIRPYEINFAKVFAFHLLKPANTLQAYSQNSHLLNFFHTKSKPTIFINFYNDRKGKFANPLKKSHYSVCILEKTSQNELSINVKNKIASFKKPLNFDIFNDIKVGDNIKFQARDINLIQGKVSARTISNFTIGTSYNPKTFYSIDIIKVHHWTKVRYI